MTDPDTSPGETFRERIRSLIDDQRELLDALDE